MRVRIGRLCLYGLGLLAVVGSMNAHLFATALAATPEIDGASISAGLALLSGGFLILRSRRRSK